MAASLIHEHVASYYTGRLKQHGPSAKGVDWNSPQSQELRFQQILRVCPRPGEGHFSILDYGCGYGALYGYLQQQGYDVKYCGFDISQDMVNQAKQIYGADSSPSFISDANAIPRSDYAVSSGIFNVRLLFDDERWRSYILAELARIAGLSEQGFSFNMLTSYSDTEYMREDLYYGDPCFFFDHCKRQYSRHVALLHDYGLYEFTILVRRDSDATRS